MTFADIIARAMRGRGKLRSSEIYIRVHREARKQRWPLTKSWQAMVRNTMQRHCRKSGKFCGTERFIYHQKAIWELRK